MDTAQDDPAADAAEPEQEVYKLLLEGKTYAEEEDGECDICIAGGSLPCCDEPTVTLTSQNPSEVRPRRLE